jgi:hypothetical protein
MLVTTEALGMSVCVSRIPQVLESVTSGKCILVTRLTAGLSSMAFIGRSAQRLKRKLHGTNTIRPQPFSRAVPSQMDYSGEDSQSLKRECGVALCLRTCVGISFISDRST